jgi:hypothetical protein
MAQARVLRDTTDQLISDLRVLIGELDSGTRRGLGVDAELRFLGVIT